MLRVAGFTKCMHGDFFHVEGAPDSSTGTLSEIAARHTLWAMCPHSSTACTHVQTARMKLPTEKSLASDVGQFPKLFKNTRQRSLTNHCCPHLLSIDTATPIAVKYIKELEERSDLRISHLAVSD